MIAVVLGNCSCDDVSDLMFLGNRWLGHRSRFGGFPWAKTVIQAIVANQFFLAFVEFADFASEAGVIVVKQLRACGGCLGVRRR